MKYIILFTMLLMFSCNHLYDDGYDDGYSLGFDQGKIEGIEEGRRQGYNQANNEGKYCNNCGYYVY